MWMGLWAGMWGLIAAPRYSSARPSGTFVAVPQRWIAAVMSFGSGALF